ncbi:MAG: hypothetical protein HY075_00195 [Deltaproteobacteria bacterium]|nr:hypothetical protein [Deltaproteobacteria bacterium]
MKRISICGVDGTGKTSVIQKIQQRFSATPAEACAFRVTQYHDDPRAPLGELSALIDRVSVQADKTGDPLLKTSALFLAMTMFGDVEAYYAETFKPRFLFSERQALADSLAYSKFYKGLLTGPLKRDALDAETTLKLGRWVETVRARVPADSPVDTTRLDLLTLPLFIRALFDLPPPELVAHLKAIYRCATPNEVVLLKVSPTKLAERMAQKAAGGAQRELHEKLHVLEALQGGLEQCCRLLSTFAPSLEFHALDTSELSIEAACERVYELTGVR